MQCTNLSLLPRSLYNNDDNIIIIDYQYLCSLSNEALNLLSSILDQLGKESAYAQELPSIITTSDKFLQQAEQDDQIIYLLLDRSKHLIIGLIKMGIKNLFYRHLNGQIDELFNSICCLDFYIHYNAQRRGFGRVLFDYMLQYQSIKADQIAYDKPSHKLIAFLKKYYQLYDYIPQNNNFVIFNAYFSYNSKEEERKSTNTLNYTYPNHTTNRSSSLSQQQHQSINFNQSLPYQYKRPY